MEGEMSNFIKVCLTAAFSGCYCYTISNSTKKGVLRLLLILPVAAAFAAAPYTLSSCHLIITAWFFLTGLGISKLLLFSFDAGPLSSQNHLSLPHFICTLVLPIKLKNPDPTGSGSGRVSLWRWALFGVKLVGFGCVIEAYNYRQGMSYLGLLALYCCHAYLLLEIILVLSGALAGASLGLELAPQADEPYFSSSLQDFWGRRWNLMVSDMLRQTVFNPIRSTVTPFTGKKLAILIGVLASFLVSGLMHEWIFSVLARATPTWEVTCFFVLHGACLAVEMTVKTMVSGKWRLHRAVSGPLTVGFVAATSIWLFFQPLLRNNVHERVIDEYAIVGRFVKRNVMYLFWQ